MQTFIAFHAGRRLASGPLSTVALAVAKALRHQPAGPVLAFDGQTGEIVDIDVRGTDAEILARLPSPASSESGGDAPEPIVARGRGRPKLGVVAREVTLLPRHWEWLAAQPGGASVGLRRLVDEARRAEGSKGEIRQRQERTYRFISAIAGDEAGFEEASRALFAGDRSRFVEHMASWPGDVREHALQLAFGTEPSP